MIQEALKNQAQMFYMFWPRSTVNQYVVKKKQVQSVAKKVEKYGSWLPEMLLGHY